MKIMKIHRYCQENNLSICTSNLDDCVCRTFYLNFRLCDFAKIYADLLIKKKEKAIHQLLESVCKQRRHEVLYWNYTVKYSQPDKQKSLLELKRGDRVYCTTEFSDVIFLEKEKPPSDFIKYKTLDGKEKRKYSDHFCIISKGNKYAEYIVDGDNYEERTIIIERKARGCGFRVEKTKRKNSYYLQIFGDTQDHVNDFVTLCCQDKYTLYF